VFAPFPPGFPAVPPYCIQTFDVDAMQTSQGTTQNFRCVNAGFIKHTPPRMAACVVACPLVPGVPPLLAGSCASPRIVGLRLPSDPTSRGRPGPAPRLRLRAYLARGLAPRSLWAMPGMLGLSRTGHRVGFRVEPVVTQPAPPQTRTCATNASGSSVIRVSAPP